MNWDKSSASMSRPSAIAAGPNSPGVYREIARGLMLLDDANRDRAMDLLEKAMALPSDTAIDRIDRERADALLRELKS